MFCEFLGFVSKAAVLIAAALENLGENRGLEQDVIIFRRSKSIKYNVKPCKNNEKQGEHQKNCAASQLKQLFIKIL